MQRLIRGVRWFWDVEVAAKLLVDLLLGEAEPLFGRLFSAFFDPLGENAPEGLLPPSKKRLGACLHQYLCSRDIGRDIRDLENSGRIQQQLVVRGATAFNKLPYSCFEVRFRRFLGEVHLLVESWLDLLLNELFLKLEFTKTGFPYALGAGQVRLPAADRGFGFFLCETALAELLE